MPFFLLGTRRPQQTSTPERSVFLRCTNRNNKIHATPSPLTLVPMLSNDMFAGVERGCAEVSERVGGVWADGARDFTVGGCGEVEEVQRGDAASRTEGGVLVASDLGFRLLCGCFF